MSQVLNTSATCCLRCRVCLLVGLLFSAGQSTGLCDEFRILQTESNRVRLFDEFQPGATELPSGKMSRVTTIDINVSRSLADWEQCLSKFTSARTIIVTTTRDSEFITTWLKNVNSVEKLDLHSAQLTVGSAKDLKSLPRLKEIVLGPEHQTVEYLDAICLIPKLQSLTLDGDELSPKMLLRLNGSQSLHHLDLSQVVLTERLAKALTQLENVTSLVLGKVEPAALTHLVLADQHKRLVFDASGSSPTEVLQIAGMSRLNYIVINNSPFPPTAIPFLRSKGAMTQSERTAYYERMRRAVETKCDRTVMPQDGGVMAGDSTTDERLQRIEFQITFLKSQLREYPRIRHSGGFLGGLYAQAEDAGNFAARSMILEDLAELEQQRVALIRRAPNERTRENMEFSAEELQFGTAFGLISF